MRGKITSVLVAAILGATLATVGGCETQGRLFPENAPRSQFDRYDLLRGRAVDQQVRGPAGYNEPNLRERLRPISTP